MVKDTAKNMVRAIVPLPARKRLSIWVSRLKWVDPDRRNWWAVELIRDFSEKDVNEYHKFLWANHLSYAMTYEASSRFGKENMKVSSVGSVSTQLRKSSRSWRSAVRSATSCVTWKRTFSRPPKGLTA